LAQILFVVLSVPILSVELTLKLTAAYTGHVKNDATEDVCGSLKVIRGGQIREAEVEARRSQRRHGDAAG